jgi:hypothetical protein
MRLVAYILALLCVAAALAYFFVPAGSLPTFMPGFEAGSAHIHIKHAVIAVVAAVVLFVIARLIGRRSY